MADRVTDLKTRTLVDRGMVITGQILMDPETEEYAFVDQGRVQWMGKGLALTILGHAPPPEDIDASTFRKRVIADLRQHHVIMDEPNDKKD